MPETQQVHKLFDIDVTETSIVDHPAHTVEGWVVMKSAEQGHIDGLFGPESTTKGTVMAEDQSKTPTVEDLQKALAAKDQELAAARDELAKALDAAPKPDAQEEMLKALPPAVQAMLKERDDKLAKIEKDAAEQRAAFIKAEEKRADEKAVSEMKEMFKSVTVDADAVAPALRLLPEAARDEITKALKAADEQLRQSNLFKSTGSDADPVTGGTAAPLSKIDAAVAELQKADSTLSRPDAMAKAVAANPDLYTEYMNALHTKAVN